MTSETDEQFLDSMEQWVIGSLVFKKEHRDRLFALARRGAAVQARKGEQRTICEACGNSNLAHDRAAWTDDGTSYCPSCLPPPPAGEPEHD